MELPLDIRARLTSLNWDNAPYLRWLLESPQIATHYAKKYDLHLESILPYSSKALLIRCSSLEYGNCILKMSCEQIAKEAYALRALADPPYVPQVYQIEDCAYLMEDLGDLLLGKDQPDMGLAFLCTWIKEASSWKTKAHQLSENLPQRAEGNFHLHGDLQGSNLGLRANGIPVIWDAQGGTGPVACDLGLFAVRANLDESQVEKLAACSNQSEKSILWWQGWWSNEVGKSKF